jgi:hypothetical protein
MNFSVSNWLMPLNLFEIVGNLCCLKMHNECSKNQLVKHLFCYNARSLFEANMLIIWGSLSPKLVAHIYTYISFLPLRHVVLHIKGCNTESPLKDMSRILIIETCSLTKEAGRNAIREARRCLTA